MKIIFFLFVFAFTPFIAFSQTDSSKHKEEYIEVIFYYEKSLEPKMYIDDGKRREEKKITGSRMHVINKLAEDGWVLQNFTSHTKVPSSVAGTLPAGDTYYIYVMKRKKQ